MNRIRVILADDHEVVRAGLRGLLASQADFEIIGEAQDGLEAAQLAARLSPDVILMDLRMPAMDGVEAIARIRAGQPGARILVLTTYDSDSDILRAIEAGATGYLLKDTPSAALFDAVRAAARGEPVLAPTVAARLMARVRGPAQEALSEREVEVLRLVRRGATNREIGRALHISEATVKSHLIHIFGKLGVSDRTAAVTAATERGVL
jgi:DNA-binding NarL/FixJ family response regulator